MGWWDPGFRDKSRDYFRKASIPKAEPVILFYKNGAATCISLQNLLQRSIKKLMHLPKHIRQQDRPVFQHSLQECRPGAAAQHRPAGSAAADTGGEGSGELRRRCRDWASSPGASVRVKSTLPPPPPPSPPLSFVKPGTEWARLVRFLNNPSKKSRIVQVWGILKP